MWKKRLCRCWFCVHGCGEQWFVFVLQPQPWRSQLGLFLVKRRRFQWCDTEREKEWGAFEFVLWIGHRKETRTSWLHSPITLEVNRSTIVVRRSFALLRDSIFPYWSSNILKTKIVVNSIHIFIWRNSSKYWVVCIKSSKMWVVYCIRDIKCHMWNKSETYLCPFSILHHSNIAQTAHNDGRAENSRKTNLHY